MPESDTPNPPTATERQEWARLCEAATSGDWVCETVERPKVRSAAPEEAAAIVASSGWRHQVLFGDVRVRSNVADRNLAVAARNAMPRLLTALDAAEQRAERAEGERAAAGLEVHRLWRRLPHPFALVPSSSACDFCGASRAEHDRTQGVIASAESALAALEPRLAEVAPVVEAAERQEAKQRKARKSFSGQTDALGVIDHCMAADSWAAATDATEEAVRAYHAARAKREKGGAA